MTSLRKNLRHLRTLLEFYDPLGFKKGKSIAVVRFDPIQTAYGLTDRLRHILSVFLVCQELNIPFRIDHQSPFALNDILIPSTYDWRLKPGEISKSLLMTKRLELYSYFKSSDITEEEESCNQYRILQRGLIGKQQIHVYGNSHIMKERWADTFKFLFRPSPALQAALDNLSLPSSYTAITLRFQNLLGDFEERYFNPTSESRKEYLIQKCIDKIKTLISESGLDNSPVLLTSDSRRFLYEAKKHIHNIITIPGEMAHFSQSGKGLDVYMKSFIDLFALAKAEKITLLRTEDMYNSGFPEFAALIGKKDFSIIEF